MHRIVSLLCLALLTPLAAAGVVQAQVFAAGVLADPHSSSSADHSVITSNLRLIRVIPSTFDLAGNHLVIAPALIQLAQRHAR